MSVHPLKPQANGVTSDASATYIAASEIDSTFGGSSVDLLSSRLGSSVLSFSDEYFAAAANLISPVAPIHRPGHFVHTGAWYDGWETRRHNPEEYDWVVIKLGVASGRVKGIEINTAFFNGNHAPEIAVQGCFVTADDADTQVADPKFTGWSSVLEKIECGPTQRQAWLLKDQDKAVTHVRLLMYPDGGIARFRLYGTVVPVLPQDASAVLDLAAATNGGVGIKCSDEHFGSFHNLILPGRGKDMGDGWETKRTRGVHVDWAIIKLGLPGEIDRIVVDTAHYRGNFPQKVQVFAAEDTVDGVAPDHEHHDRWTQILAPSKTGPDKEHEYQKGQLEAVQGKLYAFVKLVMIPDGGVKRIRVFGRRGPLDPTA